MPYFSLLHDVRIEEAGTTPSSAMKLISGTDIVEKSIESSMATQDDHPNRLAELNGDGNPHSAFTFIHRISIAFYFPHRPSDPGVGVESLTKQNLSDPRTKLGSDPS